MRRYTLSRLIQLIPIRIGATFLCSLYYSLVSCATVRI